MVPDGPGPDPASIQPGAHELLKAAKERQTQHAGRSGSSITSHVPNFYGIGVGIQCISITQCTYRVLLVLGISQQ